MWICPKCGREFKRKNQSHYCGKAPANVEEYIESQEEKIRQHLWEMKNAICRSVPDVVERIAWSMPTYEKGDKSISFVACKNHISFYVGVDAINCFENELKEFATKKSAIYLPYNKELPVVVIEDLTKYCLK